MNTTVKLWYGREQQPAANASISARYHDPVSGCSGYLNAKDRTSCGGRIRISGTNFVPAISGGSIADCGAWNELVGAIEDGVFLTIHVTVRESWRSREKNGILILRKRKDAPLLSITIPLLSLAGSTLGKAHILGRFDRVNLQQATQEGVPVVRGLQPYTLPSAVDRAMTIVEEEPEITPAVVEVVKELANDDGETVHVPVRRRSRKINL